MLTHFNSSQYNGYKYTHASVYSVVTVKHHLKSLFLCRVNVDFQSQSVCPVGVVSSTIDPAKLPPNRLFVVNITKVSLLFCFYFPIIST